MAEDLTNVYDIHHPSPPPLKQLASISISLQLWRQEIEKYRATNSLDKLELKKKISSNALKSLLPSTLFSDIEEYSKKFGESINNWLEFRCNHLLDFHRDDPNEILRDFDDFVYDLDGCIHYGRTAKRMMLSDRFSIDEKFKIACAHCFEDDVLRIWPSLTTKVNPDDIDFDKHPVLFYWICRLTNQMQKLPGFYFDIDDSAEVKMLKTVHTLGWTTTGYFWDRLNPDERWKGAVNVAWHNQWRFCRYVLAKLNEQDLDKFMAEDRKASSPVLVAILTFPSDLRIILPTWTFIRHKLSKHEVLDAARIIFQQETNCSFGTLDSSIPSGIWRSTPNIMKQHVMRELLPDSSLFVRNERSILKFRMVSFLLEVLSDAPFEERAAFWSTNWRNLIIDCKAKDLSSLMKLCFNDDNEIIQFKESTLSKYGNIKPQCSKLFLRGDFKELNNLISFCCPTEQAGRNVKQNLLINEYELNIAFIYEAELFDEFVKDAFNSNVDEIRNFKIKSVSSPDQDENKSMFYAIWWGNFRPLMNFVDRFVVSRKKAVYLKKRYFPNLFCSLLANCRIPFDTKDNDLSDFIQWCFENNERDVAKLKQTLVMDELIPNIIRKIVAQAKEMNSSSRERRKGPINYLYKLDKILEWYFVSPKAVENFKTKWADLFEMMS